MHGVQRDELIDQQIIAERVRIDATQRQLFVELRSEGHESVIAAWAIFPLT